MFLQVVHQIKEKASGFPETSQGFAFLAKFKNSQCS